MDVYEHLQKQDNASRYVIRLVRIDMGGESLDDRIRRIAREEIRSVLGRR